LLKTLHAYISRDLARITLLALVAFTLIMTVFAIIEPLRKQGLGADQVLALFAYTIPVMLSLTLPIAALLAATIVYGRFAQDNELMACRASGVSTLTLLRPALVLGGLVTVISLLLNNFVAPRMAMLTENAARANIKNIAYNQLRTRGYIKFSGYLVHADRAFPDSDTLEGVVLADARKAERPLMVAARTAKVYFTTYGNRSFLSVYPIDPVVPFARRTGGELPKADRLYFEAELPSVVKEEPGWYDWSQLIGTLGEPSRNQEVKDALEEIRRDLCYGRLMKEIADAINSGRAYAKIRSSHGDVYEIQAAGAVAGDKETDLLGESEGRRQPVTVTAKRGGRADYTVTAEKGRVRVTWSPRSNTSIVDIVLDGPAVKRYSDGRPAQRRDEEPPIGPLDIPADIQTRAEGTSLEDIYAADASLTSSERILKKIHQLKDQTIRKLIGKIKAEMHGRIAYGVSCFLLVAVGAALGLLFRGGQVISAFAISVAPAAVVIVLVIMGKQMVANPGVSQAAGLACIWSGIALLLAGNAVLYAHLARK